MHKINAPQAPLDGLAVADGQAGQPDPPPQRRALRIARRRHEQLVACRARVSGRRRGQLSHRACAKSHAAPVLYLARHGATDWTETGLHAGLNDLPMAVDDERDDLRLGPRLPGTCLVQVWVGHLQWVGCICAPAGFGAPAQGDPDLAECVCGTCEGRRTEGIRAERPDWQLFRNVASAGESHAEVGERADWVIARVRAVPGDVLLFSSRHFLCTLAAHGPELPPCGGRCYLLGDDALSKLGYEQAPTFGFEHHVGASGSPNGMQVPGASTPHKALHQFLGISAEHVVEVAKRVHGA